MDDNTVKKVLIIEDNQETVTIYKTKLSLEGFVVAYASTGKQGVEVAKSFEPDLILLDLLMPEMNGFSVLEALKNENISAKVIVFSNINEDSDIQKAYSLGASKFIVKSMITPKEMVDIINSEL